MLKSHEIKALSDKMNFNIKTTEHCLKILFSENSSTIDNDVMHKEEIVEFLRICLKGKNKKERDKLFYTKFLPKLAKKDNKINTVVYFIRDNFFSAMLAYFDAIEGNKFDKRFDCLILDNLDTFYASMPEDYFIYPKLCRKKSDIVGTLIAQILKTIDLKDHGCVFEEDYIVKLSVEIAKEVGFQLFVIDWLRDVLVSVEELGTYKEMLKKASDGLLSHRKDTKGEYIFIFCLCEFLKNKGYKLEDAYKQLNPILNRADTSIRRRYYQLKKEMKQKGVDYRNLIKIHGYEFKINQTIKKMNKISVS